MYIVLKKWILCLNVAYKAMSRKPCDDKYHKSDSNSFTSYQVVANTDTTFQITQKTKSCLSTLFTS